MNNMKNILWGLFLIVIGIIFGLNALEITNIDLFFDGWWTLFIIVPCFIDLFNEKEKTGNIIELIIGLFLLLAAQGIVEFEMLFKLAVPTLLIIFGLSMTFKNSSKKDCIPDIENELEYTATFSGQTIDFNDKEFSGCNIDAIFGGIKCDLSKSTVKSESLINSCAIFGGIDILVSKNVKVVVKSTSIFGGVTNKCGKNDKTKKILYVNALCLFGGVDILDKNTEDN